MKRLGEIICQHSKTLLDNKQHAIVCAVLFSILPFATWLSVALVALVTLRKGPKFGLEILMPALVFHSVPLMMLVPLDSVLINTLISYLPAFLAAIVLRKTASWPAVFGVLFLQMFFLCFFVQLFVPHFAIDQFNQFKMLLTQYQEYQQVINASLEGVDVHSLAELFLGLQLLTVLISTVASLLCARSIQARLFMPGGFRGELRRFRSGRLSFLILLGVGVASYYKIALAINLLPFVVVYFILSGFGLTTYILARKNQHLKVLVVLCALIVLKPTFVLFAFVVFGSLDSLFNFRLYLPNRVREST